MKMENNQSKKGASFDTKWERKEQPSQNDILTNSYMNNLRADASLRAEIMSDTELMNAYARNERAYRTEKREKNAPKKEDKSPIVIKLLKKPLEWVIEQIKAVTEAIKAGMLRVALGTEGVNKVVENTRKDDEKAERKALQEREIADMDKNAIREELNKRFHPKEKENEAEKGEDSRENGRTDDDHKQPNNAGRSKSDTKGPEDKNESPSQGTDEQKKKNAPEKKKQEPSLGQNDGNRLQRMYLGSIGVKGKDKEGHEINYPGQYNEFKNSIETYFKKEYGINLVVKTEEMDKENRTGYLQFTVGNKEYGKPSIKYMGHGNVVIDGDKSKSEQIKNLISHYINNYDKDSQKGRAASGIYPSQKEIIAMLEEFKAQQDKDKIETNFYGVNITGVKDGDKGYVFQFGDSDSRFLCHPKDFSEDSVKEYFKKAVYKEIDSVLDKAYENAKTQSKENKTTSKTRAEKKNERPSTNKKKNQTKEPVQPEEDKTTKTDVSVADPEQEDQVPIGSIFNNMPQETKSDNELIPRELGEWEEECKALESNNQNEEKTNEENREQNEEQIDLQQTIDTGTEEIEFC